MSREQWKKLNIDTRTAKDIEEKIAELALLYDTGWHLDLEKSDIGSALARIFASQMKENIERVNDIMDRYHTEFVNMLDISLLPARPSSGIVVLNLVADTIEGTGVPKGTKFLTTGEDSLIFETDHSIYVTSSRIEASFITDGQAGSFVPLLGDFEVPKIYEAASTSRAEDIDDMSEAALMELADSMPDDIMVSNSAAGNDEAVVSEFISTAAPSFSPFTLFREHNGIGINAALFYHPFLFDVTEDDLYVKILGNEELVSEIAAGKYKFSYPASDGLMDITDVELLEDGETFRLEKNTKSIEVLFGEKKYHLLVLRTDEILDESRRVKKVEFSAKGKGVPADSVTNGINDLDVNAFAPFTDTLTLYAECYIGHETYFAKAGAKITINFRLTFEENRISLTSEELQEELKVIKPRPRAARDEVYSDAFVDEIAIEYYNGLGWKRLPFKDEIKNLFDSSSIGEISLSFICPSDWVGSLEGAFEGRSLRIQIIRSDNCYLRPATHHYPVIQGLSISYSYEDRYMRASRMEAISGIKRFDLSAKQYGKKGVVLFRASEYDEDALYLGLSNRIESGPATLLFELEDQVAYNGVDATFEYSTQNGFKKMRVIDYTMGFTRSGVVAFVPPADWMAKEIEGKNLYWLRLLRSKTEELEGRDANLPVINDIVMNAVEVSNIETKDTEEVFIEEVVPGMRFSLGATGILDADVWVNEMGQYSQERMRAMEDADPENVRSERDLSGVITAFYVRWKEVERVDVSDEPRVYQLDRLTNELIFGDGIHTWIPRVLDDVAVRFTVRSCDGAAGNVPANSITDSEGYLMYIGNVTNPLKSYGGSNIEDLDNALERGASILSSRNRLVTMDDYVRAILAYSDTIDQVAGIVGETIDGIKTESDLTFILLMKEFEEGSYAFHRIVGGLKTHLMERCELTVVPDKLHLVEPIFVEISVSIWVDIVDIDNSFEIQNLLSDCMDEYLNPLGREGGKGWRIGVIPKKPQILMRMGILKSRAIVRKSSMVASYTDIDGFHECALEELKASPFMVVRSGKHQVHILY